MFDVRFVTVVVTAFFVCALPSMAATSYDLTPASFSQASNEDVASMRKDLTDSGFEFNIKAYQLIIDGHEVTKLSEPLTVENAQAVAYHLRVLGGYPLEECSPFEAWTNVREMVLEHSPSEVKALRNFRTAMQVFELRQDATMSRWQAFTYRYVYDDFGTVDFFLLFNRTSGQVLFVETGYID